MKKSLNHLWLPFPFPMRYTTLHTLYMCIVHETFTPRFSAWMIQRKWSSTLVMGWEWRHNAKEGKRKREQNTTTHIQISWNRWQLHNTYGGNNILRASSNHKHRHVLYKHTMNQRLVRIKIKHWYFWRCSLNWIFFSCSKIIIVKVMRRSLSSIEREKKCFTAIYIIWIMCVKFVIVCMCSSL